MKKLVLAGMTALTALALSVGAAACSPDSAAKNEFELPQTAAQSYSFSAASAGTIISAMNGGSAAQTARALTAVTDEATIAELNDYMMLVESLLSDGSFGTVYETSDRPEYAVKAVISYTDITGAKLGYTMYYNESNQNTHTESDWDDGRLEEESETRADIDGVLVIDGADYPFSGRTKTETEGNESESETTFSVQMGTTAEGLQKVMRVNRESESEHDETEEEYSYTIYEGRTETERSTLKVEQERGETEIEMTVRKNGQSQVFSFEKEADERNAIHITVGGNGSVEEYVVRVLTDENGNSYYEYSTRDGGSFHFSRHGQENGAQNRYGK